MPDIGKIHERLKEKYPEATCSLAYGGDPWKLLVAARLSAQCTDERVNVVCVPLFERFPEAEDIAKAEVREIEEIIRPCGLYHTKAQSIHDSAVLLTEEYAGRVPDTMEELLKFPGVGRKIANLLLGDCFGKPGIVADTHCIRINGRLGFYPTSLKDPGKVERILADIVPQPEQADYCHRMVLFGREHCMARSPGCRDCPLRDLCEYEQKTV